MNKKWNYRICFSKVTPESAEQGDYSETGEDKAGAETLRDIMATARSYGIMKRSHNDITQWWEASGEDIDYRTGETTQYTLHIDGLTARNFARLNSVMGKRMRM